MMVPSSPVEFAEPPRGIPETLTVGPHDYQVRSDDDTSQLLRADGYRGDCHSDTHIIRIDPDRPASGVAETLLHETLHALWDQTGLRADDAISGHDEVVITALAPGLLAVLRSNPDLVNYLLGKAG